MNWTWYQAQDKYQQFRYSHPDTTLYDWLAYAGDTVTVTDADALEMYSEWCLAQDVATEAEWPLLPAWCKAMRVVIAKPRGNVGVDRDKRCAICAGRWCSCKPAALLTSTTTVDSALAPDAVFKKRVRRSKKKAAQPVADEAPRRLNLSGKGL